MRMVSRRLFAVFLLLGVTLCHAEILPRRGSVDPRVREVIFDKNDVISLIGYEGYQTHLKLADDEEFIGVGAGDTGGLDITAEGNDTWIKPKAVMVRTNFDLKTNKHVYHFDYQSRKSLPKNRNTMIYSITFRYCGSPAMKPVEAYDDGMQTHIKFSAYAEFPAIFVENDDQTEALINFHIDPETGEVVVHRIGRRFVLRRGDLVGCIENRQFTGGGKRTTTGTVNQEVIRETKQTEEASQ